MALFSLVASYRQDDLAMGRARSAKHSGIERFFPSFVDLKGGMGCAVKSCEDFLNSKEASR